MWKECIATIEKNGHDPNISLMVQKIDSNKWSIHLTKVFMNNCTKELHINPTWELTIPENIKHENSVY